MTDDQLRPLPDESSYEACLFLDEQAQEERQCMCPEVWCTSYLKKMIDHRMHSAHAIEFFLIRRKASLDLLAMGSFNFSIKTN